MAVSQTEAIATVIGAINGPVFATQPAKAVPSVFLQFLPHASLLIAANDPLLLVQQYIAANSESLQTETVSVVTDAATVMANLPFVTLDSYKSHAVVVHVELSLFDYGVATALSTAAYPVFVSQTVKDAHAYAHAAYAAANAQKSTVFHLYAPAAPQAVTLQRDTAEVGLLHEALAAYKIAPFAALNKATKARDAVVLLGQATPQLVAAATAAGALLIGVGVYQPFDTDALLALLPPAVDSLTFVEQTNAVTTFSPLLLEFFKGYAAQASPRPFRAVVAAKLGYVAPDRADAAVQNLLANTRSEKPVQNLSFGRLNELSTKAHQLQAAQTADSVRSAADMELAYLKVLKQVNAASTVLNDFDASTVGASNPEFGFGRFLQFSERQQELVRAVGDAVHRGAFSALQNAAIIEHLSQWLVDVRANRAYAELPALVKLLEADGGEDAQSLLANKEYFAVHPSWLVGSDAWAYDLGASGVHHVIALGRNINMLVVDSEPYSAKKTGARKKDIGLYAMNYGNCYVASVALYSLYTQVLQALLEAERFDGPSVVVAYLPYHSEHADVLSVLRETKTAVDCGYWPLYRFDPTREESVQFQLDSSALRTQLKDFLARENRLTVLAKRNPELLRNLAASANHEGAVRQATIADESYRQLVQGLSGPPLTIGFASDGGNAEAVARKINRQALARGLKAVVLLMDDLSVEDLPSETNVVLVTSTAGQGEIPGNGKAFWDALKAAQDLDLSGVRYSVFGLGDSKYWPRKEDKHYYNKPAHDLAGKFALYGAVELAPLGLGDDQDPDGFSTGYDAWLPQIWTALGVDNVEGVEEPKPLTNEDMKILSDFLRGTIAPALVDDSTGAICAVDQQLTKFHGIYMQDDRDIRDERKLQGLEPAYLFMVRLRLPGGAASPHQYLRLDELADTRGNGTLKITTRATFQLHGIVKHNLKPAIRGMNATLLDTLAACGDVNRNVMLSALPGNATVHEQIAADGTLISEHLLPETTAYHEIWLEGPDAGDKPGDSDVWENRKDGPKKKKTMVAGNALVDYEPLYGPTYLPRKFKVVITVPPYNDVDVYAHDVGLIAIVEDNVVVGYNLLAGGGMGSTHNNTKTYPRTGSMMGFVARDKVHKACENVMLVQRDNGDRTNRKHARLKYTIDDMGVDKFRATVEEYWGEKFEEPRPFTITSNIDYFGWVTDEHGLNHFTAFIENGRIEDTPELPQKTGLKKIAEYLEEGNRLGEFRLTGNQHLVLSNIADADLADVKNLLAEYKLDNTNFSALRLGSSSCVALPTCGLAMAESERYLPELVSKLETALEDFGLRHDSVVMRMTGCPNGCARPWLAEVALVGKALGAYNLMLGGGHHGQRLNKIYRYSIKEDEIMDILLPLFKRWSLERHEGEPFGDFCIRIGVINETTEGKYFHEGIPEEA